MFIRPTSYLHSLNAPDFCFESIEDDLIVSLLKKLDVSKAIGDDGIPSSFLKVLFGFLSKPLTCIVNKSLTSGIVPQLWKKAIVTPLQKKRNAAGMTNYRPISVLPVLSGKSGTASTRRSFLTP